MLKKFLISSAATLAVLSCRAGELERQYRALCTDIGLEYTASTESESSNPMAETLLMATAKDFEELQKVGNSISTDYLWLSMEENDETVTVFGEELPDDNIGLIVLVSAGGQNLLIYMEGDTSILGKIHIGN